MNNLKEWRKKYKGLGIPTFPVKGKRPLVEWKKYQNELPADNEIETADYYYATGIAGTTGEFSGIIVIDCDIKNSKKRCDQKIIERLKSEGHAEAKTGSGGSHFIVKFDPSLGFNSNDGVLPGLDIKGTGGCFTLPPSLALYDQDELEYAHYNENKYEWIKEFKREELKPFPAWLLNLIKSKNPKFNNSNTKEKLDYSKAIKGTTEGNRNGLAVKVIGKYLSGAKSEKDFEVAWEAIRVWNTQNLPPIPEEELKAKFNFYREKELNKNSKTKKEISEPEKEIVGRIKKIDKLERKLSFEGWQEIIKSNFPELLFPAEYGLSIIAQILIKEITNPFSLVYVDVPSAGKTIAINFFSEIDGLTYATDKFTPASFVSNASNVKKDKLAEVDLLPKLKYKMFLIRDLATIFSKRDDDLNECLGILTRVLDGEGFNADTGVHGKRHYVGEFLFMILAGSTPIPPRVWKMMGSLGSRLFFLNMGARDKSEDELADQITTLSHKEKEDICRSATKDFLFTLWKKYPNGADWDKQKDDRELIKIITRCAMLLARLRGIIQVWVELDSEGNQYSYNPPVIEKPDRITQLFYNLCRGHALATSRNQISENDLKLIVELAIDSCQPIRAKLFRKLLAQNGSMKTSDIKTALNCSEPTALKEMTTLEILGVCHITQDSSGEIGMPEKILNLNKEFGWFLSKECKSIRDITN